MNFRHACIFHPNTAIGMPIDLGSDVSNVTFVYSGTGFSSNSFDSPFKFCTIYLSSLIGGDWHNLAQRIIGCLAIFVFISVMDPHHARLNSVSI